ncbi:hypothetical protein AB0M20_15790, partial [Actinoplanes sp. NPDC051633]|uniref:hypothetical protein n=1 Tax=Actinoplanes sp. NPDC051633 TaxID=3155670 RepID=UPI00344A6131
STSAARNATSAGDQRARTVRLTTRGRESIESARRAQAALEREVIAKVGADTVTAAKEALAALLESIGAADRVRTRSVPAPPD